MAKTYSQNSFNGGELSPRLKGRSDLDKFKSGLLTCLNALPLPHGGATRRSGLKYINSVKDSTQEVELIPFEFSEDQSYVLEFGDEYMRVFMDGGRVVTVDSYTHLLLHMDGTDGSITFTDDGTIGHTVSANGNAQIDTSQYYFASASGEFDGVGDYLSIPDAASWYFGSNKFTLDFWVRFYSVTGIHSFWYQSDATAGDYIWFHQDHARGKIVFRAIDAGAYVYEIQRDWVPVVDTWYHVTLLRGWDSGSSNWAICIDGTILDDDDSYAATLPNHNQQIEIGGLATANTIYDFSLYAHVLTKVNNVTVSSAQAKYGDASIYFDGTGDEITIPDHTGWDILALDNATLSLWVKHTDHAGSENYVCHYEDANNYWIFSHIHGSGVRFLVKDAGSTVLEVAAAGEITDTNWHHVALVKELITYGIYVDGVQKSHLVDTSTDTFTGILYIGGIATTSPFDGYMNDIQLVYADYFDADPGYPFIDATARHGHFAKTGVTLSPSTYKFANGSLLFNGITGYLAKVNHADWDITSQTDFTVDFFVKHTDHVGTECYFNQYQDANNYYHFHHVHGSGMRFRMYAGGVDLFSSDWATEITDTNWHHVALVKVGTIYAVYLDGTQTSYATNLFDNTYTGNFYIGVFNASANFFDGYIDEFRITWANSFGADPDAGKTDTITVPTAEHTPDADTKLLLHMDGDEFAVPTVPPTIDSANTALLIRGDLYGLDGWLDEFRLSYNVARWTENFTPATQEYPGGGGSTPYELATPYAAADDVHELRVVQSADTLFIAHPDYNVYRLTRSDHDSWAIAEIDWDEPPWNELNTTATTLDPSAVTGDDIDVVASAAFFSSLHVGAYFKQANGFYRITAVTDSINAVADVKSDLDDHLPTADWQQGAWDDSQGYPSYLTFHEDRLVAVGDAYHPLRVFFSGTADYENFGLQDDPVDADDPLNNDVWSQKLNVSKWAVSGKKLFIGTVGSEFWITGSAIDAPITASSILVRRETTIGSTGVAPLTIGSSVIHVQKDGKKLRDWHYDFDNDGYVGSDIQILADHLTKDSTIRKIQYAQDPNSVIWIILEDGTLLSLTYMKDHKVIGFASHDSTDSTGDAVFESIAIIPGSDGDEVWVAVNRTVDGDTARYIERIEPQFFGGGISEDAFFVDSGLSSLNGTPATTFGGLDHLVGETVQVMADGAYRGDFVVSEAGEITITGAAATDVHAGLGFNTDLVLVVPRESGMTKMATDYNRIFRVSCMLYDTGDGCQIGKDLSNLLDIAGLTDGSTNTGTYRQTFNGDYDLFPTVALRQGDPTSFTLLAVFTDIDEGDEK